MRAEALRAEKLTRALLDSAPDAMVVVGADGVIQLVNTRTEELFGIPRGELVGRPVEVLVPERLGQRHRDHRDAYVAEPRVRGVDTGMELYGRRRDGSEFPIEVSLSPLDTDEGLLVTAAIRDITDRKRAEETARQAAAIVESSHDAMIGKDLEGTITSWNAGAAQLYGYTADEVIGQSISILIPSDTHDDLSEILACLKRGESVRQETVRKRKDQSRLDVSLTISVIRDAKGLVVGASTVARDVTERKQAEERFRGLLEAEPDAMVIVGSDGVVELVNARTEAMFGYTSEEVIGEVVDLLVPERFRGQHPAHRDAYVGQPRVRLMGADSELYGRRKDGSEFPIEVSLSPLRTEGGMLVSAAIRDITERKRVETLLRVRSDDLARSNAELEQFAYVASHDLQEPLRHISSFVQKLADRYSDVVDERGQRYIGYVVEGTTRMQSLIDGLLEFSRVGRVQPEHRPIDLDKIVAAAERAVSVRVEEAGAIIDIACLPQVLGDEGLLYRLFVNLFSNAIKFARDDRVPRVEVRAEASTGGRWRVIVSDNGIGIELQYRERAFEIFERLNGQDYPGTGIGLSVARRIVEAHRGVIELGESPEGGTAVKFTLPACDFEQSGPS